MNAQIVSGNFTANGNFTGYTALGLRIHLFARQMESLGFSEETPPTFPIFVVAQEREYERTVTAEDGTESTEHFSRLTAASAFATREQFIAAHVVERTLDAEIDFAVTKAVSSLELTESKLQELANATD